MTRQEAVNWLINVTSDIGKTEYRNLWHYEQALCEIKEMLEQPTIELKKGKWMPHNEKSREYIGAVLVNAEYDYWFCDTCGYRVENGQPMYNFCPNCGADMRGE